MYVCMLVSLSVRLSYSQAVGELSSQSASQPVTMFACIWYSVLPCVLCVFGMACMFGLPCMIACLPAGMYSCLYLCMYVCMRFRDAVQSLRQYILRPLCPSLCMPLYVCCMYCMLWVICMSFISRLSFFFIGVCLFPFRSVCLYVCLFAFVYIYAPLHVCML